MVWRTDKVSIALYPEAVSAYLEAGKIVLSLRHLRARLALGRLHIATGGGETRLWLAHTLSTAKARRHHGFPVCWKRIDDSVHDIVYVERVFLRFRHAEVGSNDDIYEAET